VEKKSYSDLQVKINDNTTKISTLTNTIQSNLDCINSKTRTVSSQTTQKDADKKAALDKLNEIKVMIGKEDPTNLISSYNRLDSSDSTETIEKFVENAKDDLHVFLLDLPNDVQITQLALKNRRRRLRRMRRRRMI